MAHRSIWWVNGHGQANYDEGEFRLPGPPQLVPGVVVNEIEYIPRAKSAWVNYEVEGEISSRQLTPEECLLLDAVLAKMREHGLRALGYL